MPLLAVSSKHGDSLACSAMRAALALAGNWEDDWLPLPRCAEQNNRENASARGPATHHRQPSESAQTVSASAPSAWCPFCLVPLLPGAPYACCPFCLLPLCLLPLMPAAPYACCPLCLLPLIPGAPMPAPPYAYCPYACCPLCLVLLIPSAPAMRPRGGVR